MQKHSSFRTALPTACFPPPPASVRDSVICSCTQITFSLQLTQKAKRVRDTPGRGAEDSSKVLAVSGRLPRHCGRQASLGPPRVPLPGMPPAPGGLLTWVLFALDCRHLTHFNILAGSEICFLLSPQLKKKNRITICVRLPWGRAGSGDSLLTGSLEAAADLSHLVPQCQALTV